jgi:hypothetical protein
MKATIKMYVAVGLDVDELAREQEFESDRGTAKSPYVQTAHVFLSTEKRADAKARKLLGKEPKFICQIGKVNVDLSGSKYSPPMMIAPDAPMYACEVVNFMATDTNDSDEPGEQGVTVFMEAEAVKA